MQQRLLNTPVKRAHTHIIDEASLTRDRLKQIKIEAVDNNTIDANLTK